MKKTILLSGVLLIALVLFGCLGGQPAQPSAAPIAAASIAPTQTPAPSSEQPPAAPGSLTDCKTDFDCFIDASKTCALATASPTATVGMFGMLITATTFYEIRGMQAGKCVLFVKSGKQEARFSDSLRQQMFAAGSTQAEITQAEQQATENAKATEGRTGTCKFASNNDLTVLLTKTKAGNAEGSVSCKSTAGGAFDCESTGDWSVADCEGNLFTSETIS